MDLSVLIVNYNVRVFLENALASVCKAMGNLQGEVIVVDNASDDGSVEMVRQKFPSVKLIVNEKNLGFAAANNQGLKLAHGRYILLVNPDTLIQEDTFRVMLEYLESHPEVGLAGCKILNPDGTLQLACRRSFPTPWVAFTKVSGLSALFPRSPLFARYNLTYLDPDQSYNVEAVSGSFMFLRREVVEKIGGLDETFFMYGEDLDWCYRIHQAGWKIAYVHSTQIIHYKGESARRSDIDEVRHFYEAMRLFVRKHFRLGMFSDTIIRFGIAFREWMAFFAKIAKPLRAALLDFLLINFSLHLGELLWFGELFRFPSHAYPVTTIVPWLVLATTMLSMGVYTTRKLSIPRVLGSTILGYVALSALTFFFKDYAFSRGVVLVSGVMNLFMLPGWRLIVRRFSRSAELRRGSLFGRRTLIVGVGDSGRDVLRKLRERAADGYTVVGFVDTSRLHIGEKVLGVEILGSIDNIGKVIRDSRATEVIFSADVLSYGEILSVIGRSQDRLVNYRLVPRSLEFIIGKTHIDELGDLPLVEIEYKINRPANRFAKRLFDIIGSTVLLLAFGLFMGSEKRRQLRQVFRGDMSLVGPSLSGNGDSSRQSSLYWGKPGIASLADINDRDHLSPEEYEKLNVYYAKNQSLMLDLEILIKSFRQIFTR